MAEISPLRRRMIEEHDRPQHVAGDAAILRQRGFEVQPVLRPLARQTDAGRRSRFPSPSRIDGYFVAQS
jgi:hypothetical protein